ncbi:tetratricopeptide repeat protein [Clostridium scatologenes]|uniref:Tetratricopeptide repeat protein n=1 Tax=Clostridium scatologenes TaxID=1548 RepID=A0A0E3MBA1_CLOSL|nr:tetratricopeptide repeat protein [Clostridium scatologenes]AKA71465.1 tetratricopeptide repeat protein [Clostridium scatologenes]
MDRSKKIYIKASNKYNNGYIDKAMDLCEESISLDIKNAASINLKGLLHYLKGDIDSARKLWKMNHQINNDGVSEKYLASTKSDESRLYTYEKAISLIKGLYINEALDLLEQCSESDYNYINVNNYKALCYIKKGQYDKAIDSIENVMKIDKNNSMAKENKKVLVKCGVIKNKIDTKQAIYCLIGVLLIIVVTFGSTAIFKKVKSNVAKSHSAKTSKVNVEKVANNNGNKATKEAPKKIQQEAFPADKIKSDIQNKNFDNLYDDYIRWKDKNISNDDKEVISSVINILKNEGVEYFYGKGDGYINSQDIPNAKNNLTKAYEIGSDNYLYPHIIYMLGTSFYLSSDPQNAIKYYTQYDEKYGTDDYEETVLYALATMYKDLDKDKAATYAQKLVDKYPKSIYNNSVIKSLIRK